MVQKTTLETGPQPTPSVTYRISKFTKTMMVSVSILFDLLPILLIILAALLVSYQINDAMAAACGGKEYFSWWQTGYWVTRLGCVAGTTLSVAAGGATIFLIGPTMYMVLSVVVNIVAFLLLPIWFMFKGVNYFSLQRGGLTILLTTFIIEMIPVLNLLPGITVSTIKRISISRKEDFEKHSNMHA